MGTPGTRTRNGKKPAPRRAAAANGQHPAVAKLAVALSEHKEALEQQAATAEILRALSRSSSDLQPVFEAIVEHAHRLCAAVFSILYGYDGKLMTVIAHRVNASASRALRTLYPAAPRKDHIVGRAILEGRVMHSSDVLNDPRFRANRNAFMKAMPFRAGLEVPLLRNGAVLGVIAVGRLEPKPFSKKEIGLLKTFADQAVIAIENARLFNETKEALEHQKASADILRIVAGSVENIDPVFQAITEAGMRLVPGSRVGLLVIRDGQLHHASHSGIPQDQLATLAKHFPAPLDRQTIAGASILDSRVIQITDIAAEGDRYPRSLQAARASGDRSLLVVPLLHGANAVGSLSIRRAQPGAFTDKQVGLARTFADQAVIAIRNARLFNETKEALERQTASADILRVISSTPTDTRPVFDAIVQSAQRLVSGKSAVLLLRRETDFFVAAYSIPGLDSLPPEVRTAPLDRDKNYPSRVMLDGEIVHVPDWEADDVIEFEKIVGKAYGIGSGVEVPLLRKGEGIGALAVTRQTKGPFSEKEIALLQSFADQAVIAIENVRLFNETKEALEQQTAISEVLRVISDSPTDVKPVLDAVAVRAAKICEATDARIWLVEGDSARHVAGFGDVPMPIGLGEALPLDRGTVSGRAILDCAPVHVEDMAKLTREDYPISREMQERSGFRTILSVPLMREQRSLGAIMLRRLEVRSFSDKQIALLKTFADQAAIAIENVRLFNETKEALDRQTATGEILKVISSSPTDTQPVFEAIARTAVRLFGTSVVLRLAKGTSMERVAELSPGNRELKKGDTTPLDEGSFSGRAIMRRELVHVADISIEPWTSDQTKQIAARGGYRSGVFAPMMREGEAIGAVGLIRQAPGPFNDKQIALLQTFADQAVIAIENVRLFNETKEALERQTATAEILRVISASPTDVQPVFDAIVQAADRLCDGRLSTVLRFDGESLDLVAHHNLSTEGLEAYRQVYPQRVSRNTMAGRALLDRKVINITDSQDDPDIPPQSRAMAVASGFRSVLVVPMLREGEPIGVLNIARAEPGSFSQAQVELLKTFADQAVIAIENVRLFNETKEALEQQTAISEILRVISDSPADVQPVLDAVAARAGRICDASDARIFLVEGETLRHAAGFGDVPMIVPLGDAMPLNRGSAMGRSVIDRAPVHVDDMQNQSADEYPQGRKVAEQAGWHTVLAVPLLREGRSLGAMVLRRMEVRSFSDKQIALLKTFADQAAIAIENVRLFNETKEALERQTATAEILKVISDSPIDVQPVFEAILARAAALCNASFGNVFRYDGAILEMVACNLPAASIEILRKDYPSAPSRGKVSGRVVLDRQVMEIPDVLDEPDYQGTAPKASGHRSLLGVPLLREGQAIGAIVIARHEPGRFTPRQVAMVQTFADQAVIAIENVRLFKELQARTEALSKSVGQLTALGDVGRAITSTLDLETVLKTIVQRAVQLTGLDGGSIYEYDEATEQFTLQAAENMEQELVEAVRRTPVRKGEGAIGRSAVSLEPVQVPDILDEGYRSARKEVLVRAGYRAILAVPLLQEDHVLGVILVHRKAPGPFASEVVELLKTFATQSAMAIQNARLFREIAEKGKQLEVASQHKSQFLASMSHELRTPLNALLGFNEMLLGDVYGEVPGEMQPPLAQMQSSGKHLLRLINNVLDLAKIEAGRMELALADYSVQDTVESVRSTLQPLAADKGLEFVAAVPADIPLAYGDPGRITQCLMNLAGNSLKFTKAGKVEISVTMSDGRLRYCVADTGIGIPSDKIDGLFTEFKQTDATVASEYGGTGLGLSISKKFVEMHGGRIWAQSEPGKGSVFAFEIPLRAGAT